MPKNELMQVQGATRRQVIASAAAIAGVALLPTSSFAARSSWRVNFLFGVVSASK